AINFYERKVDPRTGKPLDVLGRPKTEKDARQFDAGNRQLFDLVCSATVGVAATLLPQLGDACVFDVLNIKQQLGLVPPTIPIPHPPPAQALGSVLAAKPVQLTPTLMINPGNIVLNALLTGVPNLAPAQLLVVPLNADPNDGPPSGFLGGGLGGVLTDQQEA